MRTHENTSRDRWNITTLYTLRFFFSSIHKSAYSFTFHSICRAPDTKFFFSFCFIIVRNIMPYIQGTASSGKTQIVKREKSFAAVGLSKYTHNKLTLCKSRNASFRIHDISLAFKRLEKKTFFFFLNKEETSKQQYMMM